MHDLLLYDFNLRYNLMKNVLLEHVIVYKKFVRQFQILQKNNYKNSDIKIFERLKNIIELDDSLLRIIEKKNKIYMIKQ